MIFVSIGGITRNNSVKCNYLSCQRSIPHNSDDSAACVIWVA